MRGSGVKKDLLPNICHTYPTMMKVGTVIPFLKKIQKKYKLFGRPVEFYRHQHFSSEIGNFCYVKKYRYRLHLIPILLHFSESLKVALLKMVAILIVSAKLETIGLLKIRYFESIFMSMTYRQNVIT